MINANDIPKKLIELHTILSDKMGEQCLNPDFSVRAVDNNPFQLVLWGQNVYSTRYTFSADTIEECFKLAHTHIKELPSLKEIQLGEFQKALAKLIDQGRAHNISLDFVNPLIATAKRLAENVITDQRKK